ncbi:MAG: [NiFe]-hydrogenase assembly, chaperone, HybE [Betaproteobacteria bacterium HGW-Betaproteobacteria-13]|jgi:[NiFe] hydrogenase assembly HybE family chaperone|nr:MAG: [NiFe]-hydrogenase assembly, chaperone, HybE [Betaproteobacteria bacterium HGW-Betaproteobacteria-19]PKO79446.1 MAG: [NiFe]-hydrogenase assembly, chaperone, HybE [Betaproteobacteria bacterium HGW-Betaproteobacteria-13]
MSPTTSAGLSGFAHDPAPELRACFAAIAAGPMAGLPLCNPALEVAAIGFRSWQGEWLGALLTPWSLSLVLIPGGGGLFRPLAADERQCWSFPSGEYAFLGNREPELGPYQMCSLYSPVFEFESQADAEAVAHAALDALFVAADGAAEAGAAAEQARLQGESVAAAPVSRRDFLRGGLLLRGRG